MLGTCWECRVVGQRAKDARRMRVWRVVDSYLIYRQLSDIEMDIV